MACHRDLDSRDFIRGTLHEGKYAVEFSILASFEVARGSKLNWGQFE